MKFKVSLPYRNHDMTPPAHELHRSVERNKTTAHAQRSATDLRIGTKAGPGTRGPTMLVPKSSTKNRETPDISCSSETRELKMWQISGATMARDLRRG